MPQRFDSFPSAWSTELVSPEPTRPSPGKVTMTQRMAAAPASPAAEPTAPVRREIDPVAAAIQRRQTEHDLAAAAGFLGGPAPTVDASLVQMQADVHTGLTDDEIGARAAAGVAGAGAALPHLDTIQSAFGPHDVTGVRAHVGGAAADASAAIGARAYASGNDVAFAREPDLFLAAHEAAHIVQQRQGVSLKGAVGQAGDAYEQHADAVAAAVVRGESAAALLGQVAPGDGTGAGLVQRATTSTWTPQGLGSVTIDGSAYLAPAATGPVSYENQFGKGGRDADASVEIGHGFEGVLRIHLMGTAHPSWSSPMDLPKSAIPKLDLLAIWNLDYHDEVMTLRFDDTLLKTTRYPNTALGDIQLAVEHTENERAFLGHPGSVTLQVTPKLVDSAVNADLEYAGIGLKVGDCDLPPMTFLVPIHALGKDPLVKEREEKKKPPAPSTVFNDNRRYTTNITAPTDDRPPLPGDLRYGYEVRFKREGDTVPPAAEIRHLDTFLADVDSFNQTLLDADRPTIEHWYKLRVTGHASDTSKPATDKKVGLDRAEWVRAYVATDLGLVIDTDAVVASKGHKASAAAGAAAAAEGTEHEPSADYVDKRAVLEFIPR